MINNAISFVLIIRLVTFQTLMDRTGNTENPKIAYSCYHNQSRDGEQFVREHVFSYQVSGTFIINDKKKQYICTEGEYRLIRRNNLVKYLKQPPSNGDFKSFSIYLGQQMLRDLSVNYSADKTKSFNDDAVIKLSPHPLLKSYMDSLRPYQQNNNIQIDTKLQDLKAREGLMVLLQCQPELQNILFDFSEPGKIDLKGFMEENFHFNVHLERFAYLTGRSLATFKRDFEKTFNTTPSRWLQQRRLQEAYYQLKEKRKSASEIYLELGFENLSHFSFAFKNKFGVSPSKL